MKNKSRLIAGYSALVLGMLILIASVVWPMYDDGRSAWSEESATEFASAGRRIHELSFALPTDSNRQELAELEQRHESLQEQLTQAQTRGDRIGWRLRITAATLVAVGFVALRSGSRDK